MQTQQEPPPLQQRLRETATLFLRLGCTSFGGPVAHIGYFHEAVVVRHRWIDEASFADLVALCQALPGPASSQLVFALGRQRAGLAGAILASLCFTLPSALLMIGFGYGMLSLTGMSGMGWIRGLKLAAVAVVAQALWSMGRRLCPDRARLLLALGCAGLLLWLPGAVPQLAAMCLGGLLGWLLYRNQESPTKPGDSTPVGSHGWALLSLGGLAALLLGLPLAARLLGWDALRWFDAFYRSGALVFGGGHVVLPLLRAELVPTGWMSDAQFLAGYGAAQALPGPLFTLAGYLGTVLQGGRQAWLGGCVCLLGIFLPAWLLIGGALPFWHSLRSKAWMQAALKGTNAAVVGLLLAAFINPIALEGLTLTRDYFMAFACVVALERFKVPSWIIVLACAAYAQWPLP